MDTNILIPIGKRIAEIRRAHNTTQEKLAELLDVSPKHISHAECGSSSLSLKNLMQFCNIFECSLDYVIFGAKENSPLSKLPIQIVDLLNYGTEKDIDRLNRYLQMYIELTEEYH